MRYFLLACLLSVGLTAEGRAQASPAEVKHLNECRFAEQIMTTGRPERHREWARGYVGYCGTEA